MDQERGDDGGRGRRRRRDATPRSESSPVPDAAAEEDPGSRRQAAAVAAVRSRLGPVLGGRPLAVYGVLAAGVVVLLILLAIIWFTAADRDEPPSAVCLSSSAAEAANQVHAHQAESLTLVYDQTAITDPSESRFGPALARLDLVDNSCYNLPQGIGGRDALYHVLGVIAFYNSVTEYRQVEVLYEGQPTLPDALFQIQTPIISPASPTAAPVGTSTPTTVPTEPASPEPASPQPGSPALATPSPDPTSTPAPTPTIAARG